jgi:serine/threonine protein kinase
MVWETIHRQSGLRYATKIIDRRTLSPCEDAAVFWEASILEQLPSGEGTISCVDFFQEPHHFFLVSEYAQGGSLQVRLANLKYLPEIQVKDLARSLLEGLQSLHSQDICHRNLKPDNILLHLMEDRLDQEETTLIAGFGSAVHIPYFEGIRGKLTGMCGSSFYAAPEVQSRLPYDTQADMWSLGVVLFVTLSGSLPFVDRDRRGLLRKIRKAEYIFDPKDWSGVSKGARRFIRKLLRANPQERMTVEQALEDPWLALPEPCVAVDEPIELSLTETTTKTRKVSFDEISKPPTKKKRQHRFMSILRRAPLAVIEEDEESSSSKTTTSSDSTDPGFTGTIFEI